VFLTLMVIGLAGLVLMALPALGGHGHGHTHGAHGHGHAPALGRGGLHGRLGGGRSGGGGHGAIVRGRSEILATNPVTATLLRFVPSPRAICSVLAVYGAIGNALERGAHLPLLVAALAAVLPALLVEWALVRPVWNLVFRFQGTPSAPLDSLILAEATAVVPFRNGRGIVSAVREGRAVQLSARLIDAQATWPVRVGDRLRVEDVDGGRERVTVSVLSGPGPAPSLKA
jgi:hypothetical protein